MPKATTMRYILFCLFSITFNRNFAFVLDKQNPYSQFRKWNAGLNGTVELEFKTDQQNGLLLYTDDGGTYDFFELKLVNGQLRLRYNLGGGAQIIAVGSNLNDGHWHKLQVARRDEHTSLTVDGDTQSKTSRGKEFVFGKFISNSDVFVGGIPPSYNSKLTTLTLPSVIFEPKFRGAVRNLVYSDLPGQPPRRQELRHSRDLKSSRTTNASGDACERRDPCQHGGVCISTDDGPVCECRDGDYEGAFCERDKAPSEATFRGAEFLSYDLTQTGGEPIVSTQDAISLYFKTRQPNGLLFYTGHEADYLNLAVRDGGVSLTMGLGNGKQEIHIKPPKTRFDDHQWHKLTVHRKIQEVSSGAMSFCRVSAIVDDVYMEHSHVAGTFTMLASSRAHVGGSLNARALPGARVHNNFIGCLKKVEFSADTLRLNLIDLARTGSKLITVTGRLDYACTAVDHADPVTFATRDAHLVRHSPTAFTAVVPVKRQLKANIGLRNVSDGSRHGNHHHGYRNHTWVRNRNHKNNTQKLVHHSDSKTVEQNIESTPNRILVHYNVTFKNVNNTYTGPIENSNLTSNRGVPLNRSIYATAETDDKHKIAPAREISTFIDHDVLTPITKEVESDNGQITAKENIYDSVRHYHPDSDDDLLSRAIKISIPVTFKDPIPTLPSKKSDINAKIYINVKKTDQDITTTPFKQNEENNRNVFIKIVASKPANRVKSPIFLKLRNAEEVKAEVEDFEKRLHAALSDPHSEFSKRLKMSAKQADQQLQLFPKSYTTPVKPIAEILQNSTFLIT